MAFEDKYIRFGKVTFTSCSVSVWSDQFHNRNLPNIPQRVVNAYWQSYQIFVETDLGWVYVYDGFSNYAHQWKKMISRY